VGTVKEGKAYKKIEAYGKVAEVRNRGKFLCMKKCNIKNTGKSRAKCVNRGWEEYCKEKRLTVWNDLYYSVTWCVQNECCRENCGRFVWCQASLQDRFCRFSGDIWMAAVQNHILLHVLKMDTHVTSCISSTKLCNRLYDTASLKYQIWTILTLLVTFLTNNFSCKLNHV